MLYKLHESYQLICFKCNELQLFQFTCFSLLLILYSSSNDITIIYCSVSSRDLPESNARGTIVGGSAGAHEEV